MDYAIRIPTDVRLLKVNSLFLNSQDRFPTLEEVADCACVNIRALTRLFKQTISVAYHLGYNSESAFIPMFKKMLGGKVPSQFWN